MTVSQGIKPVPVALIGSYVPRQCGIGTFTHDLASAVCKAMGVSLGENDLVQIVALNNIPGGYAYGPQVRFELRDNLKTDYRNAADFLNISAAEVINVQHEFGIYGGADGRYLLTLLGNLKKPVVTTVHTVFQEPTPGQRETFQEICRMSTFVVVMAQRARAMLRDIYDVPDEKIIFIHHGVPDVSFMDPGYYKDKFQVEGRQVMLTFGLLSPNKGIEMALDALHHVVKTHPEVVYIVLGATHPELRRHSGEEYRLSLERRVVELGLEDNVIFHNRYVTQEDLCEFLLASDLYVTPYRTRNQIVSGTLAYALGCGKAVISTPYWYAEEMLADNHGRLVPFGDADALARQIQELLDDTVTCSRLRKRAYQLGRKMIWPQVAQDYADAYSRALSEYGRLRRSLAIRPRPSRSLSLPDIDLRHIKSLTDDTGIIQHATFATPDRVHGYCTDDNARGLLVASLNWEALHDENIFPMCQTYLAFLYHAFDSDRGRFRNFMSYDRHWQEKMGSEDSHGRAVWSLGHCVVAKPTEPIAGLASKLFVQALKACSTHKSPRAWAFAALGCHAYLRRFAGASAVRRLRTTLARRLLKLFKANGSVDWPWCEDILTYANAKLPHALIAAGKATNNEEMLDQGLRSLRWLLKIQTHRRQGHLSVIGCNGWYPRGGTKARFDQQPIEAASLIGACCEAYLATGDEYWFERMRLCFDWFLGRNDLREPVYDFSTGGCRDGLHHSGPNMNQGAEATLVWLYALHIMHEIATERTLDHRHGFNMSEGIERLEAVDSADAHNRLSPSPPAEGDNRRTSSRSKLPARPSRRARGPR